MGYLFTGAIYRGDRREAIFTDDHDRQLFLDTLGETCQKTDWQLSQVMCCMASILCGSDFGFRTSFGFLPARGFAAAGRVIWLSDFALRCLL